MIILLSLFALFLPTLPSFESLFSFKSYLLFLEPQRLLLLLILALFPPFFQLSQLDFKEVALYAALAGIACILLAPHMFYKLCGFFLISGIIYSCWAGKSGEKSIWRVSRTFFGILSVGIFISAFLTIISDKTLYEDLFLDEMMRISMVNESDLSAQFLQALRSSPVYLELSRPVSREEVEHMLLQKYPNLSKEVLKVYTDVGVVMLTECKRAVLRAFEQVGERISANKAQLKLMLRSVPAVAQVLKYLPLLFSLALSGIFSLLSYLLSVASLVFGLLIRRVLEH